MSRMQRVLAATGATGAGVVAGVFFAFSSFVMSALAEIPHREGTSAMRAINRRAPNPGFMTLFLGTGAVCLALGGAAWRNRSETWARHQLVGSATFLAGIAVTIGYHVPKNNELAVSEADDTDWNRYVMGWTRWNHARTLTSLGASASLLLSLIENGRTTLRP